MIIQCRKCDSLYKADEIIEIQECRYCGLPIEQIQQSGITSESIAKDNKYVIKFIFKIIVLSLALSIIYYFTNHHPLVKNQNSIAFIITTKMLSSLLYLVAIFTLTPTQNLRVIRFWIRSRFILITMIISYYLSFAYSHDLILKKYIKFHEAYLAEVIVLISSVTFYKFIPSKSYKKPILRNIYFITCVIVLNLISLLIALS